MKQILVIGGNSNAAADVAEIRDFAGGVQQAVADNGMVQYVTLDQLYFVFAPGDFRIAETKGQKQLSVYSLVVLRSKMRAYSTLAYCISKYCQDKRLPYFNDYSRYFNGTKLIQAVQFYEQKVPFLKTVYALDHTVLLKAVDDELGYPCIIKDSHGAHGRSNYLVHSAAEASSVLAKEPDIQFIAQAYCPNDRDYRVLVLDAGHLVFERIGTGDTHLNNTSQGAQASLAENALPPDILRGAHALALAMGLCMAGVDVMPNRETGELYFLEVNSQPQLFTGALLPEKAALFKRFLENQF